MLYTCIHCDTSCANRTCLNRHMKYHMTTDVKFLESQETFFLKPGEFETGYCLENKILEEIVKDPKLSMANIETSFTKSLNLDDENVDETSSGSDLDDYLEDVDYMYDDEEYYVDLESVVPDLTENKPVSESNNKMSFELDRKTTDNHVVKDTAENYFGDIDFFDEEDGDDYVDLESVTKLMEETKGSME